MIWHRVVQKPLPPNQRRLGNLAFAIAVFATVHCNSVQPSNGIAVLSTTPIPWKHVRNIIVLFAPLWIGTTALFAVLGLFYAIFTSDVYTAKIGLVVRDEATSSVDRLGRFPSQTEMKAAQETILEMVQNPETIAAALRRIGPPGGGVDEDYPTQSQVESASESAVNLQAPKGSEFGNTEVVYLSTKANSSDRAREFCEAMFDSLTQQLRSVRGLRADSLINELLHARDLAKEDLRKATVRLHAIEIQFGEDLGELRNLKDTISGEGANRRSLEELTVQLQTAELDLKQYQSLIETLHAGAADPNQLLIAGEELLTDQPSLQRLKEGLIDAQLASSQLAGIYTESNPKRRAAVATETEIRSQLQAESQRAISAMQPKLALQQELVSRLVERQKQIRGRLDHLAKFRTEYASVDSDVKHRTDLLGEATRSLAEATAARSAALNTNLVAKFGPVQSAQSPAGPGSLTVTGGATAAGLMLGLGIVFLVAPTPSSGGVGRRWSDYLVAGRRTSDRATMPAGVANRPQSELAADPAATEPSAGISIPDVQNDRRSTPDSI